jgi:Glycosyl transferases group 1.
MLNIISKSVLSNYTSGPQKVVKNLIKGLDLLDYPYVLNGAPDSCKRLWIHDDLDALYTLNNLNPDIKTIVGPNLFSLVKQVPNEIDFSKVVYIHPSPWARDFWIDQGFDKCPVDFWPVGIDTEIHKPSLNKKETVLIYFKSRFPEELKEVENILENKKIKYKTIVYGSYDHKDYIETLTEVKYIIWIGRQESQGIALEEALSMNIPILVWDVKKVGHWLASIKEMTMFNEYENNYTNTTAAYYFDDRCGLKIKELDELVGGVDFMEKYWTNFKPREYILENLNLKKQAEEFLGLYEKYYGLTIEDGLKEKRLNNKKWKNSKIVFLLYIRFKDFVKKIIR